MIGSLNNLKVDKIDLLKVGNKINYASYYSATELLNVINESIHEVSIIIWWESKVNGMRTRSELESKIN